MKLGHRLMRQADLEGETALQRGRLIRGRHTHQVFVVTGVYGGRATAVFTVDVTNPIEWEVLEWDDETEAGSG